MNELLLSLPLKFNSVVDMCMILVISVLSTVLMVFVGYKLMQMLQLTGYKLRGYVRWFKETKYSYISRLFMLSFLSLASMLMTNVLLADFFVISELQFISIIFYILFCSIFINNLFTAKQKTPLKYTKRMTRFLIAYIVLVLIFNFVIAYVGYRFIPYLSFSIIAIVPVTLPLFVFVSFYIMLPIEKAISHSYIKKAKIKLKSLKNVKVIGITGSYGKTTVKNILGTILSEKYKVCVTPSSYNTPLGLAKTILSNLTPDDEIFLAEMGAKQRYDINELCNMVEPQIGVITGIGNQHLLTFGSTEMIIQTKGELAEYVSLHSGELFVSAVSDGAKQLASGFSQAKLVSLEQGELKVKNIKTTSEGSEFDLTLKNKSVRCKTILLGKHNIENILLSASVALTLGLSLEEIACGIEKLVTIPHRLEIVKSSSTYTIIDDAYNSSVEGSKASIDVLSKFEGRKFVITPGLVELGAEQFNSNFEFGKNMASVCDYVIIDSAINFDAISSGLVFAGFDESHIIQAGTLSQAVEILSEIASANDVVLFENDLPDNYS